MSFYVYIIQSIKNSSYYKGFTEDPLLRLQRHNNGESIYTRNKIPWKIVFLELHASKRDGLKRERALKKYNHKQIQRLIVSSKNHLSLFLNLNSVDKT